MMGKSIVKLLLICALMSGNVKGVTYYVSTQGSDANDGLSERSAWRTISHAAKVAKAGDTVLVLPGDYGPECVVVANSGREGAPIVFRSLKPAEAILGDLNLTCGKTLGYEIPPTNPWEKRRNKLVKPRQAFAIFRKSHIVIDGFKIANYLIGIEIGGGMEETSDILITNCVIIDCRNNVRVLGAKNITIKHNAFYDTTGGPASDYRAFSDYSLCLYYGRNFTIVNNYFWGKSHQVVSFKACVESSVVRENVFEGFNLTAVYLGQNDEQPEKQRCKDLVVKRNVFRPCKGRRAHDAIVIRNVDNTVVRDNFIEGTDSSGIYVLGFDEEAKVYGSAKNVQIYRNIIVNTRCPAIRFLGACDGWKVFNNTIVNCDAALEFTRVSGKEVFRGNIFYRNRTPIIGDSGASLFEGNVWYPDWPGRSDRDISLEVKFVGPLLPTIPKPPSPKFVPDFTRAKAYQLADDGLLRRGR